MRKHMAMLLLPGILVAARSCQTDTACDMPSLMFGTPSLIGSANFTGPNGSRFWFPSISIPIPGRVNTTAQHITLSGDGGECPDPKHPEQLCEQLMLTRDGGQTYTVVKTASTGTSGTFNGYGATPGTFVVPAAVETPGQFNTLVACNDCPRGTGGSVAKPIYLLTWKESSTAGLRIVRNQTTNFTGTPDEFSGKYKCGIGANWKDTCGLRGPSPSILRLRDGHSLLAFYGIGKDAPRCGAALCRTVALFQGDASGTHWSYLSRVDQTSNMPAGPGPSESSMAELADGRILMVFRVGVGSPLWKVYSGDGGKTWGIRSAITAWAVWPQLLLLSNGVLILTAGRPGIGLWVSNGTTADGSSWRHYDLEVEHNKRVTSTFTFTNSSYGPPFAPAPSKLPPWRRYPPRYPAGTKWSDTKSSSYTGTVEIEPGTVLIAYDRIAQSAPRKGNVGLLAEQQVFAMRVVVTPAETTQLPASEIERR